MTDLHKFQEIAQNTPHCNGPKACTNRIFEYGREDCEECKNDAMQALVDENGKTKICVWPDGDWCHKTSLEEYSWKSDDYSIIHVPVELDDEAINNIATDIANGVLYIDLS
jgi:hypothetical protein